MKLISIDKLAIIISAIDHNRLLLKSRILKGEKYEIRKLLEELNRDSKKIVKIVEAMIDENSKESTRIKLNFSDMSYTLYDTARNYVRPSSN
jgi:endonuclease III-like uncharacterized protein